MPFEGAVAVRYHDQVALPEERLRDSELEIIARVKDKTGGRKFGVHGACRYAADG